MASSSIRIESSAYGVSKEAKRKSRKKKSSLASLPQFEFVNEPRVYTPPTFEEYAVKSVAPAICIVQSRDFKLNTPHYYAHYGVYSNDGPRGKTRCSPCYLSDTSKTVDGLRPFRQDDGGAHLLNVSPILVASNTSNGLIHVVPSRHVYVVDGGKRGGVLIEQPGGCTITPGDFVASVREELVVTIEKNAAPSFLRRIATLFVGPKR